jgi:hypothetical protein
MSTTARNILSVACASEWIDDAQDCCIHQYPAVGVLELVTLLYRGFNSVSIMYVCGCIVQLQSVKSDRYCVLVLMAAI